METPALEAMSEDEVLAFAGACAETAWRAEVDLLHAAYQWAVLHPPQRLDPAVSGRPGWEKSRQLGGPGTPWVTEFAAAEFGARIGRTTHAAARLIGDALDLAHRCPQLWGRVRAGEVRASYARHVCARTRELPIEDAGFVDAAVADSADGRLPWTRFEALVEAKIVQADPVTAREREEQAAKARFAKKTHNQAHGMASFLIRADFATITAIDTAITAYAAHLKTVLPESSDDERRVLAVLLLVNGHQTGGRPTAPGGRPAAPGGRACRDPRTDAGPEPTPTPDLPDTPDLTGVELPDIADLLPTVTLYVHLYPGLDSEGFARVEGHGMVTETWLRQVLGPQARFKIQPVLDLSGQAPVDAYEIPDRHRQAVHLMTPADTFPFGTCTQRTMQVDHTVPYDAGGATGVGNYGPMTITHHRIKTHHLGWRVQQPFPGIYIWRDPHGGHYLVDHTGTRQLTNAAVSV